MSSKSSLTQELLPIINSLEIEDIQKSFLKLRWLDQLNWLKSRAKQSRDRYYLLRLATIIGGSLVPALVTLNLNTAAFIVSQIVAVSAATEALFHYGENHRRYRNSAESLKYEGWQFFQLSGVYSNNVHVKAFPLFSANVELILKQDLESYIQLNNKATKNS
jgi:hypothetical protein